MGRKIERGDYGDIFYEKRGSRVQARVYVRDSLGRRRRLSRVAVTKRAAKQALQEHIEETLSVEGRGSHTAGTPLSVVVSEWLGEFSDLVDQGVRHHASLNTYRLLCRAQISPRTQDWRVRDFTAPMLDTLLKDIRKDAGYAAAKSCRTVLSNVANHLVIRGSLKTNPVRDVAALERPRRKRRKKAMTPHQADEFIKYAYAWDAEHEKDIADLLLFLLATGCRIGEALAVHIDQVDFPLGTVTIDHAITRITGQGLHRGETKTASSERVLELPQWCLAVVKNRADRLECDMLFPSATGTYRDPSNVSKHLRQLRGTAWDWVTTHTFRTTMATLLDAGGSSARMISDQLGHSRVSMTQDYYLERRTRSHAASVIDLTFQGMDVYAGAHAPDGSETEV